MPQIGNQLLKTLNDTITKSEVQPPAKIELGEEMSFKQKAKLGLLQASSYGLYGAAVLQAGAGRAFATSAALDITSISSILDFIGNIITVVGLVLAGWSIAQVAMTMKESGGLQFDKNVWGVIGGIAMAIAGGVIKSAGDAWNYGTA